MNPGLELAGTLTEIQIFIETLSNEVPETSGSNSITDR